MSKVLQIYRTYFPDPPGGMQEAIRQVCLSMQPFGVESRIYALSPQPAPHTIERSEGRVLRSRSWMAPASCDLGGFDAFRRFRAAAAESDVLHYWFPWPFADLLHMTCGQQRPAVLTYVSDVVRQRALGKVYGPLMWRTLHSMKAIVANCPAYARTSPVLSDASIRDKVRIIPLGIDETSYPAVADGGVFERLGMTTNEPFFLFIGVLRYYKGVHVLLQAARDIGVRIVIAGDGPEGPALKAQAAALGLKNVIFAGQVSDAEKVALLQACHALVLPSHLRSEAYGMVLVEAAMFGKPMISCEIGTGTSFVNAHEESGLVVPPEQPEQLAVAMNLLLNESGVARSLGRGARVRYEALFSGPALGRAYSALFADVAKSS